MQLWFDYMINSQKIENDECYQIQTQVEIKMDVKPH